MCRTVCAFGDPHVHLSCDLKGQERDSPWAPALTCRAIDVIAKQLTLQGCVAKCAETNCSYYIFANDCQSSISPMEPLEQPDVFSRSSLLARGLVCLIDSIKVLPYSPYNQGWSAGDQGKASGDMLLPQEDHESVCLTHKDCPICWPARGPPALFHFLTSRSEQNMVIEANAHICSQARAIRSGHPKQRAVNIQSPTDALLPSRCASACPQHKQIEVMDGPWQ